MSSASLLEEASNSEEMAKHSYKKAFIRDLRGDQSGAAYWRGRARGLELAAHNMRLAFAEAQDQSPDTPDPSLTSSTEITP